MRNFQMAASWAINLAILVLSTTLISMPASSEPAHQSLSQDIELILKKHNVPGASIALIEGGEVSLEFQYGVTSQQSREPVSPTSIFRAGSISKSVTSIAIMILVEEGALDLQTPVTKYLPDIQIDNPWSRTHPVRIAHLLEHTAGLNDIAHSHYLIEGADLTVEDAANMYGPYRARWQPGTRTSYSNSGPVLAGLIVERVANQSFERFTKDRIFDPLSIESARWIRSPDIQTRLATSYFSDGVTEESFVEIPGRPSGSLNITAKDLAFLPRLMLGQGTLNGTRIISPESAARIETPRTNNAAQNGLAHGYALGNDVDLVGKTIFFGHDGSIDGFTATARYAPELNSGYVIMLNSNTSAQIEIAQIIRTYLERELLPTPLNEAPIDPKDASRWAGQYQSITPRRSFLKPLLGLSQWQGVSFDDDLTLRFKGQDWKHVGAAKFQATHMSAPGLVFVQQGSSVRLYTGNSAYRRVPTWELWLKMAALAATLLVVAGSALYLPIWAVSGFLRRLETRGGYLVRLTCLSALVASVFAAILPVAMFGTGDFQLLGTPTALGRVVQFLTSIAALSVLLAAATIFTSQIRGAARAFAICQIAIAAIIYSYLFANGWFALRIWLM